MSRYLNYGVNDVTRIVGVSLRQLRRIVKSALGRGIARRDTFTAQELTIIKTYHRNHRSHSPATEELRRITHAIRRH